MTATVTPDPEAIRPELDGDAAPAPAGPGRGRGSGTTSLRLGVATLWLSVIVLLPLAAIAALSAVVLVASAGVALRAPLARVPENAMKFVVGVVLSSFGIFWASEGAGACWPGADAALLVLVPAVAVFALALTGVVRQGVRHARATEPAATGLRAS